MMNEEIGRRCPICSKRKALAAFTYFSCGTTNVSPVCNSCGSSMTIRLEALTQADLKICEELKLDFYSVTEYEAAVRRAGKFHREIGLMKRGEELKEEKRDG